MYSCISPLQSRRLRFVYGRGLEFTGRKYSKRWGCISLAYYSFVCSIFNSGFFGCNLDRSSPVYSSMCGISFVSLFVLQVSHLKVIQNSTDPNQCLTTSKIVSTILVCVGIFIFTMGKQSIQSVSLSSESSQ